MNVVKDVFLKEKEKFGIKCECILWYSEPWQVGLVHPRTLGKDRPGLQRCLHHLGILVSSVSISWRWFS